MQRDTQIDAGPRYQIRLLHAPRYRTNVSLRRILNHRGVAGKFRRLAPNVPPPDVILCSLPLLELCRETTEYARQRRIPVVLDVRDMWPDAIVELAPRWIRPLIRPLFRRSRRSIIHSCQSATAITGITDGLVGWALDYADRERTALDRPFPMGYREKKPHERDLVEAQKFWRRYGISTDSGEFVVCFFGTIGRHFEIETIVHAARILSSLCVLCVLVLKSGASISNCMHLKKIYRMLMSSCLSYKCLFNTPILPRVQSQCLLKKPELSSSRTAA